MVISEIVFELGLYLSRPGFLYILLIGGYVIGNKRVFAMANVLYLYAISIGIYLKSIFQVPLNVSVFGLNAGWAFPSGHTTAMSIVLIYICIHYRQVWIWLSAAAYFMMALLSIFHFHFHNEVEIVGGLLVAVALIGAQASLRLLIPMHKYLEGGIIIAANCLCAILNPFAEGHWLWITLSASVSFYVGWILFECSTVKIKYLPELLTVLMPVIMLLVAGMRFTTVQCIIYGVGVGFWMGYAIPVVYSTNGWRIKMIVARRKL